MPHNGYPGTEYALDIFTDFGSAFHLYTVGMRLFHDSDCRGNSFFGIALIGAEWHIDDD